MLRADYAPDWRAESWRGFLAALPLFFAASVMPVLVGTGWAAAHAHRFHAGLPLLALAAMVAAYAAIYVLSDNGDVVTETDAPFAGRIFPYTSGLRFIQAGLLSRPEPKRLALGLAMVALLLGAALALLRGPGVILFGGVGLLLGVLCCLPRVPLFARGIGEVAVAIGLGVLPVMGAVWLQTGTIDAGGVVIGLPVTAWAGALLIIHEVHDVEADRRAGRCTVVVRWGAPGARLIYGVLTAVALGANLAAVVYFGFPRAYALWAAVLAAVGVASLRGISTRARSRRNLHKSIERTLAIHTFGCVALLMAILIG